MTLSKRIKRQIAIYGGPLGAVIIILGIIAICGGIFIFLNPPTETIPPEESNVQSFSVTVEDSALVTGESPLYEEGTTLENRPVYFINSTPGLQLSTVIQTPSNKTVTVSQQLLLQHQAQFNGETFWENQRVLITKKKNVTSGEFRTNTSLNMSKVQNRRAEVSQEIGTVGSISTSLRLRVSYESPITNGESYEGVLNTSSSIQFSSNAYWLQSELSDSQTKRQLTQSTTRQLAPNMILVGALGLIGVILILIGGGVLLWTSAKSDVYELEHQVYREKYNEWISEGDFPTDSSNRFVYINSLEDLVDVAIDTNKRVIYDSDLEIYSVMDGEIVYYHAADPTTVSSWLEFSVED